MIDSVIVQTLPNLAPENIGLFYDQALKALSKPDKKEFWGWYLKGSYRFVEEMALTFGYGETAIGEIKPDDYKDYQQDGYLGFNYNFGSNVSLKAEAHGVIGTYYAYATSQEKQAEKK